jgi:hypothetical protein
VFRRKHLHEFSLRYHPSIEIVQSKSLRIGKTVVHFRRSDGLGAIWTSGEAR